MLVLAANADLLLSCRGVGYSAWLNELVYIAELVNHWLDTHRMLDDDPQIRRQNLAGAVSVLRMFRRFADFTLLVPDNPRKNVLHQAAGRLEHFVGAYVRGLDDYT